MDEVEALRERARRADLEADLLAERCNRSDPSVRSGWNRVTGWYVSGDWHKRPSNALEVVDSSGYTDDDLGTAAFLAAFAEARRDWLREQSVRLETQAERERAGYEAATHGIGRFLDEGRYALGRIIGTVQSDPGSLAAIRSERREQAARAAEDRRAELADRVAQRAEERRRS